MGGLLFHGMPSRWSCVKISTEGEETKQPGSWQVNCKEGDKNQAPGGEELAKTSEKGIIIKQDTKSEK